MFRVIFHPVNEKTYSYTSRSAEDAEIAFLRPRKQWNSLLRCCLVAVLSRCGAYFPPKSQKMNFAVTSHPFGCRNPTFGNPCAPLPERTRLARYFICFCGRRSPLFPFFLAFDAFCRNSRTSLLSHDFRRKVVICEPSKS